MAEQYDRASKLRIDREELEQSKFKKLITDVIAVRTCDEVAIGVLNNILTELGGAAGTAFFAEGTLTTDGTNQDLISATVPAATTRSITKVRLSCRQSGLCTVLIGATVVGTARTGPGRPDVEINFNPVRPASTGVIIKVQFEKTYGPNTEVEAYLFATDM